MTRKLSKQVMDRCLGEFRRAELAWAREGHAGTPLLLMPAELLRWGETLIYFANSGVAEQGGQRFLFLEVRAFDAALRGRGEQPEIDWCIPINHSGATERDRDVWKLGLGEGWSDSYEVAILVFGEEWQSFLAAALERGALALGEVGQSTASLLQQLDRNLGDLRLFLNID